MCGIFGIAGQPESVAATDLQAALAALHHRGPDGHGLYRSQPAGNGVAAAFAHTRLAIIDLTDAGRQPMTTPDGRYTITYNGEVYNYRDLRAELAAEGDVFQSSGDTEVVLKAFARWGIGSLSRLRGMYAFGIWDAVRHSLFLVRDRLGIKPLYYCRPVDTLAFASEVRALLATGSCSRALSPEGVAGYLAFGSVPDPATILADAQSLPAGCWARYDGREFKITRYWHLASDVDDDATFETAAGAVHGLLRDSVRSHLVSDVPLGVFLSGGIDSSCLAAVAAEVSSDSIHTFSVAFGEKEYDEATIASEVARRFGCDHHSIDLSPGRALDGLPAALAALDQPSADGINTYFVSKSARDAGITVALSGLGGDELFAGYANFRRFGRYRELGRWGRRFSGAPAVFLRSPRLPNRWNKVANVLAARGDAGATYGALRAMFDTTQIARLLKPEVLEGIEPARAALPGEAVPPSGNDDVNLFSRFEMANYLGHTLLRDTDSMSMANSLEVRVPLLDHALVEAVSRVPGRLKFRRGENKPLLTAAVGQLPRAVIDRPKKGFTLPFDVWFRDPMKMTIEEILLGNDAGSPGVFDPAAVRDLWQSFLRGSRYTSWSRIWCVAALTSWCTQHGAAIR